MEDYVKFVIGYTLDRLNNIAGQHVPNDTKEQLQIRLYELAELIAFTIAVEKSINRDND